MRTRVRDHVNPLALAFVKPPAPLRFAAVFARPDLPLHLDLGCALGGFALEMARFAPDVNFLALDIREAMIERARRHAAGIGNLHYEFCNATIALDSLLKEMPPGILQTVTIQFPDPFLKKRHLKRRMTQPALVADLARQCADGATIFIQSDVESVAADIGELFEQNTNFRRAHQEKWLAANPFPVKTERETVVEAQNLPVFRSMFEKI